MALQISLIGWLSPYLFRPTGIMHLILLQGENGRLTDFLVQLTTLMYPYNQAKTTKKTEIVFLERLQYVMTSQTGFMPRAGSTWIAIIISLSIILRMLPEPVY